MSNHVPQDRIRALNLGHEDPSGQYVLYWMVAARRTRFNFALQHAANRAEALGVPLLVFEPLRVDYPWACDRFHDFVISGMRDNQKALAKTAVRYYSYIESEVGASKGLLKSLAERASLIVSDDSPNFFLPEMLQRAANSISIRLEVVDGNGIYPIRATERVFTTAASFRRHLQKQIPDHFAVAPMRNPLARRKLKPWKSLSPSILSQWPETIHSSRSVPLESLPIDHSVGPTRQKGGMVAANRALKRFLDDSFDNYLLERNQPESHVQSRLSSYLHFGHVSAHEIFLAVMAREQWSPERISEHVSGSRNGWWGVSPTSEAFLDQLITWRELGHNMAALHPAYREYSSLPNWSQKTLAEHAGDPRPYQYSLEAFESAQTHDALWNAAQIQLVREGYIHNYLRMLWGKKILEWTPTPQVALDTMVELNNKYALDGRDANSYSGIFWTLGRYDRAWGPRRPIFGSVRFMSSANTARKVRVREYIRTYSQG